MRIANTQQYMDAWKQARRLEGALGEIMAAQEKGGKCPPHPEDEEIARRAKALRRGLAEYRRKFDKPKGRR